MNIWYSFRHDVKQTATHNARYADLKQSARANKSRTNFIGFFSSGQPDDGQDEQLSQTRKLFPIGYLLG